MPLGATYTNLGYTGTVTTWYGDIYIYFTEPEGMILRDTFLVNTTKTCGDIIDFLAVTDGDPDYMMMYNGVNYSDRVGTVKDLVISAAVVVGYSTVLMRSHIASAVANQNLGIIWVVHHDFNTGIVSWSFGAQDGTVVDGY